jgi:pimeloyl-ACP methyl ester carboxylesterase
MDLANENYPAVALDLRGHGESPLGKKEDFSPGSLAADVRESIQNLGIQGPIVLVGHSMGGRIAMRYAKDYGASSSSPPLVALVIEDMDCIPRVYSNVTKLEVCSRVEFNRNFDSWSDCEACLTQHGYDKSRLEGFKGSRIYQLKDDSWWSDINPQAQALAQSTVLASNNGLHCWDAIHELNIKNMEAFNDPLFTVHLHVAEVGSACNKMIEGGGGLKGMLQRMPECNVVHFEGSGHSIHNTTRVKFVEELKKVVDAHSL